MNRALSIRDESLDQHDDLEIRRAAGGSNTPRRRSEHHRRSRPAGFNGIHRRRNKRWRW